MATNNSTPPVAAPATARYGEVFDRGYRHYDGKRLGRPQAFKSLTLYSMKRAMGIRKPWTSKVLPFLLYTAAIIPLVVMIGISAIVPDLEFASYSGYFQGIFLTVGIFVATIAPEMVCVDRREKTLPLYFARAITRFDYVFSKLLATSLLTMTMSVLPAVLLWLGRQLVEDSPWKAMRENIGDLGKVIVIGALIALVLGTTGLAISSMTSRKGVAVTVIILAFIMLTSIAATVEELVDAEWKRYFIFLSLTDVFAGFMLDYLGTGDSAFAQEADFTALEYLAFMIGLVVVSVIFIRWRYAPRDEA
jgi:ABC-2 type transport system permease protein